MAATALTAPVAPYLEAAARDPAPPIEWPARPTLPGSTTPCRKDAGFLASDASQGMHSSMSPPSKRLKVSGATTTNP